MIRGNFLSATERERLLGLVRRPSEWRGVGRRANALLLLDDGLSCESVVKVLYLDDDTIRGWHKSYVAGGWEALEKFDWKGGSGHLSAAQETELKAQLSAALYRSTTQIRADILASYGEDFSRPGCIKLLHRLGFQYKRPKGLPARGDAADLGAPTAEPARCAQPGELSLPDRRGRADQRRHDDRAVREARGRQPTLAADGI